MNDHLNFEKIKKFYEKNQRHLMSAAFVLGFLWDSLTLTRVDLLYDNLVLTAYILIALFGIFIFHAYKAGLLESFKAEKFAEFIPLLIQFSFGGLFSGFIIFYSQSASLSGGWLFVVFLAILFIGNELLRKNYQQTIFQLSILFIACFSYLIFSLPTLLKTIGVEIFLLSGVLSIAFIFGVAFLIRAVNYKQFESAKERIAMSILSLYLIFNLAYFTNIIPPIPLSLKEGDVYHFVEKTDDGGYFVTFEKPKRYEFFRKTSGVFHLERGKPIYVLSSVFAPSELKTNIYHEWSYYDEKEGEWVSSTRISFPISGGQDGGYRGYSFKENVFPGKWRVDVLTERNQLIGRISFEVVLFGSLIEMKEEVLRL